MRWSQAPKRNDERCANPSKRSSQDAFCMLSDGTDLVMWWMGNDWQALLTRQGPRGSLFEGKIKRVESGRRPPLWLFFPLFFFSQIENRCWRTEQIFITRGPFSDATIGFHWKINTLNQLTILFKHRKCCKSFLWQVKKNIPDLKWFCSPSFCVNKLHLALTHSFLFASPPFACCCSSSCRALLCFIFSSPPLFSGVSFCDVRVANVCEHAQFLGKQTAGLYGCQLRPTFFLFPRGFALRSKTQTAGMNNYPPPPQFSFFLFLLESGTRSLCWHMSQ